MKSNIDTFVFLTPRAINSYEADKWSFAFLRNEGFGVEVINLDGIFDTNKKASLAVNNRFFENWIYDVDNYSQLETLIKEFAPHSIFVDYLVCHHDVTLKTEKIFRLLKKYQAKYIILSSGALPLASAPIQNNLNRIFFFGRRFYLLISSPRKIFSFLIRKIILLLTNRGLVYPLPYLIFGGESEVLQRYLLRRNMDKGRVIGIHSYDYDQTLKYGRSRLGKPNKKEVCVFLDEAATHHSDFYLGDEQPPNPKIYFNTMNKFFDTVEKNTGYRVIIAAHPRSNYEALGDVFDGREIVKGKTMELVAGSKMVLMHASTSVSYAVLYKKPIFLTRVPGLSKLHPINIMVDVFANELGSNVIDITNTLSHPDDLDLKVSFEKYETYEKKYIKTPGALEIPEWEIVVRSIKEKSMERVLV